MQGAVEFPLPSQSRSEGTGVMDAETAQIVFLGGANLYKLWHHSVLSPIPARPDGNPGMATVLISTLIAQTVTRNPFAYPTLNPETISLHHRAFKKHSLRHTID